MITDYPIGQRTALTWWSWSKYKGVHACKEKRGYMDWIEGGIYGIQLKSPTHRSCCVSACVHAEFAVSEYLDGRETRWDVCGKKSGCYRAKENSICIPTSVFYVFESGLRSLWDQNIIYMSQNRLETCSDPVIGNKKNCLLVKFNWSHYVVCKKKNRLLREWTPEMNHVTNHFPSNSAVLVSYD